MNSTRLLAVVAVLWIGATSGASQASGVEPSTEMSNARVEDIDATYASLTVEDCTNGCQRPRVLIAVRGADAQRELKSFKAGDHVVIQITKDGDQFVLQSISIRALQVSSFRRITALGIAGFGLLLLSAALTKFHPLLLVLGRDNRYSDSKCQMAVWFFVGIVTYLAAIYLRATSIGLDFLGGVNIPQNLLVLSGMSALSFAGAKAITANKIQNATEQGVTDPKPSAKAPSFWNLVQDDNGKFDIGDFQVVVVTLLAVGVYLVLVFHFLGALETRKTIDLPDLDTTILAAFGLGQGAYLAKKAAGTPGES